MNSGLNSYIDILTEITTMRYKMNWDEYINNLLRPEKANDAAHALASNLEVLPDILINVGKDG